MKHSWPLLLSLTLASCSSDRQSAAQLQSDETQVLPRGLLSEAQLASEFDAMINATLDAHAESGTIEGADQKKLFYVKYTHPTPRANMLIVSGFSESHLKYRELAYGFFQQGYSVVVYDHRGQGRSDRLIDEDPTRVHLDKWSYLVEDLERVLTQVKPHAELPQLIFAHSMGGAVTADLLAKRSDLAKGVVLSAPLLELNTEPYPVVLAGIIATAGDLVQKGEDRALGQKPVDPANDSIESSGTSSEARYNLYRDASLRTGLAQSGATFNWVKEVIFNSTRIAFPTEARKVSTPILMFQAGLDTFVKPKGQDSFCAAAQNCTLYRAGTSKHEPWNEADVIRTPYMQEVFMFFETKLLPK